jgi:hypothetical protein
VLDPWFGVSRHVANLAPSTGLGIGGRGADRDAPPAMRTRRRRSSANRIARCHGFLCSPPLMTIAQQCTATAAMKVAALANLTRFVPGLACSALPLGDAVGADRIGARHQLPHRPRRTRLPSGRTGEPASRPLLGGTAGKLNSPPWPRLNSPWPPPTTRRRRCPAGSTSRNSPGVHSLWLSTHEPAAGRSGQAMAAPVKKLAHRVPNGARSGLLLGPVPLRSSCCGNLRTADSFGGRRRPAAAAHAHVLPAQVPPVRRSRHLSEQPGISSRPGVEAATEDGPGQARAGRSSRS